MTKRTADILSAISIALCLGATARFLYFQAHANWGHGGEIDGAALAISAATWLMVLAGASILGLILAILALRSLPRTPLAVVAAGVNVLSLLALLALFVSWQRPVKF